MPIINSDDTKPQSRLPAIRAAQSLHVNGNGNGAGRGAAPSATVRPIAHAADPLLDRLNWLTSIGVTFDGLRNVSTQLGYKTSLTVNDYRDRYRRGGIAKRIVEAYPLAAWSADARLTEDTNTGEDTEFESAARTLFRRFNIWSVLSRANILANLGTYAVVLIGDGTPLDQPLPTSVPKLRFLTPLGEDNAKIVEYDERPSSERYLLPLYYQVNVGATDIRRSSPFSARPKTKQVKVHYTRIIHVAINTLENPLFGTPILECVWNYLDDLVKVVGGGAEAAWKRMDPGVAWNLEPPEGAEVDDAELIKIREQIDEYQHGLRRQMMTQFIKPTVLSTTVAGFGPNAGSILELISGALSIPQRILLGSERGQLASEQDRDNWSDRVIEYRRDNCEPITYDITDRFIDHGILPKPTNKAGNSSLISIGKYPYVALWPQIGALDSVKTAEVFSKLAGANQAQSQAGGGLLLTANEIRHQAAGMGPRPKEAEVGYGKPTPGVGNVGGKVDQPADTATTGTTATSDTSASP